MVLGQVLLGSYCLRASSGQSTSQEMNFTQQKKFTVLRRTRDEHLLMLANTL